MGLPDEFRNEALEKDRVHIPKKLQVSFAEYRLFYRALLQKRPVILRSLLIEGAYSQTYARYWIYCIILFFTFTPYFYHNTLWVENEE